ncbi:hypothetical protein AVEN_10301-1 [Araneus ventricosus]|uniref:Uncharacterized protein n=1 Tax=Araneus ventricosus TaxID=182803 RepID=A0A4Y2HF35_ARAVE|nr:hypothetical protein AVEN_10301-1 [Araneus ventricosus]
MSRKISLEVALASFLAGAFLFYADASTQCASAEFKCPNGRCTSITNLCDGDNDCKDNSDEEFCGSFPCHPSVFRCLNRKCITRRWFCAGSTDRCGDNSNVQYCSKFQLIAENLSKHFIFGSFCTLETRGE